LIHLPEEIGNLSILTHLYIKANEELVYPPHAVTISYTYFNVSREIVEYCGTHKDIYSRHGRRKNMWKSLRLMYIAQCDDNCIETFRKIPIELIHVIETFAISDPYYEEKQKLKRNCIFEKKISNEL